MSRKGAGLAILALASLYKISKMNNRNKKTSTIHEKVKPTRRTPLQIAKDAQSAREVEPLVYIVGSGRKYHLNKGCRAIRKDAKLTEMKMSAAIDKGYELCGWEDNDENGKTDVRRSLENEDIDKR